MEREWKAILGYGMDVRQLVEHGLSSPCPSTPESESAAVRSTESISVDVIPCGFFCCHVAEEAYAFACLTAPGTVSRSPPRR